jgi:nitroreductase
MADGKESDMERLELIKMRHSVRSYTDQKIEGEIKEELLRCMEECNKEGDLHIQLCLDEPNAFDSLMAHYGKFENVKNYISMVGPKNNELAEKCGYYGEKIVLKAQELGLNTCWVAGTYSKKKSAGKIENGEKQALVIAIGYGKTQGVPHKSKTVADVSKASGNLPEWYKRGIEAALLAPTAMNQQKFQFTLSGNKVSAKALRGFGSKLDLGIVKYHFEEAAGRENFTWKI